MSIPQFSFTRVPSVKVSVSVVLSGLVAADNTLILYGRIASGGGTATVGVPQIINNYGDPVAAATECAGYFGASSEAGAMVVAAISGILYSNLAIKGYPPIKVVPMANNTTSATLAATLASQLTLPAPYMAFPYAATDSAALTAAQNHAQAISSSDRGDNGQFGSFAFLAADVDTSTITPVGIAAASNNICIPWLRDLATTKAQAPAIVAAAYAAVCASLAVPFLPLNGISVGGLVAPSNAADWHTPGDTGTVQLGLAAGVTPLVVKGSSVTISRSITTQRTISAVADNAYYDMQDWQVLYYYRLNAYNTASQPRYAQAKGTDQKILSLKSELIKLAKDFESLEMFQHVDAFADQFIAARQPGNRFAAVYSIPVNVVPGFMNKGVALVGTSQFDSVVI